MVFYTYVHHRADDEKVFYVGKGKGDRAHSRRGRNPHWRRTAAKHGLRSEVVAHWPSEAEAFEHERFLISCFRDMGHPLCNKTDGGEGAAGHFPTEETRAKLSEAGRRRRLSDEARRCISQKNAGRKHTEETRRKNSEARKGKPLAPEHAAKIGDSLRGRVVSEETRRKISESHKGKKIPPEVVARVRAANQGRKRSDEFKAKVSAGGKGRVVSAETRAKISARHKGRVISEEQRQKISATLKQRNATLAGDK